MSNKVSVLKSGKKNYPWYVSYPDGGKRVKKYFKTKTREGGADEWAKAKADELENEGTKHAALTEEEKHAVYRFREAVESLPEYARSVSLLDAVEDFSKRLETRHRSITCQEVSDKLMSKLSKEGKSKSHLANMQSRLNRFNEEYGSWLACDVTTELIDDFLANLNRKSQTTIHYRRAIGQLFKHAITLKAAPSNPIEEAIRPKIVAAPTGVLEPQEVAKLLACADDSIVPALAISFFAGARRAEIERLDWSEVDLHEGHIEIKAENAKTAQRRLIPISENLHEWLTLYAKPRGSVVESPFILRSELEKAREKARLDNWPHNAGRHSFASYHLALNNDPGKLAMALGHPDPRLLFKHYRQLVTAKKAAIYWGISPSSRKNVTNFKSA